MTTPSESAMTKLAAIETWPTLTHSQQMTIAVVPALTSSEAAAIRERLEWRPIETAPKDGTAVLCLAADGTVRVGRRKLSFEKSGKYECFRSDEHAPGHSWSIIPTHWQPLPEPPND